MTWEEFKDRIEDALDAGLVVKFEIDRNCTHIIVDSVEEDLILPYNETLAFIDKQFYEKHQEVILDTIVLIKHVQEYYDFINGQKV